MFPLEQSNAVPHEWTHGLLPVLIWKTPLDELSQQEETVAFRLGKGRGRWETQPTQAPELPLWWELPISSLSHLQEAMPGPTVQ